MPDSLPGALGAAEWPRMAVVSHTHPSLSKGGAEIAAYAVFRGLRNLGIDALFIAGCAEADRVRLHFGTPHERAVFHEPLRYDHLYHGGSPAVARDLAGLLAAERVGLANFHHYLFLGLGAVHLAKSLAGTTSVMTLHEYLAICQNHGQMVTRPARALCEAATPEGCGDCFPEFQRSQLMLRRENFLAAFGAVDWFVSPSEFLADRYAAWGLERERISIVENGLLGFRPDHRAAPARQPDSPWVFGYFGQINQFKGMDVLLRVCELVAKRKELAGRIQFRVHGNIIGQPPAFIEAFEKATRDYPFFSYAGPYTNSAVRRLMTDCDYVIVPSTWWENSPVVIQEAYAAGRPVLCSGIGGLAEKVPEGVAGLHFRPGDAGSLIQALERAMDEPLYHRLIGGLPMPFDETEMARRYLACFRAAAGGGAEPAAAPAAQEPRKPRPSRQGRKEMSRAR